MKRLLLPLGALVVIGGVFCFWYLGGTAEEPVKSAASATGNKREDSVPQSDAVEPTRSFPSPVAVQPSDPIMSLIEGLLAKLQNGTATEADLARLREQLLAANPHQAVTIIQTFLATGKDAATSLQFAVGEGGTLKGSPTLRTFLLDLVGQIGRKAGSTIASALSKQVLQEKRSPDEWAVALRNVAWAEPHSRPYLANKMREMLSYEPWVSDPTPGMLEAFDVIAYTGDPTFLPDLASLLRSGDPVMSRAAAVALDRLSAMSPMEVMNYLNANPTEFADRPFLRADFYAKADFTKPAQRTALETYLSRTDVSVPEKTKLLQALAIPADFVSNNLLTPKPPIDADDDDRRGRQLTALLSEWQAQNRFPELRDPMLRVQHALSR